MASEEEKLLIAKDGIEEKLSLRSRVAQVATKDNIGRLMLVLLVIIAGSGDRVTFKIMQYSTINYSYFLSLFAAFVYIPVSFAVVIAKILFTQQITPDQMRFPIYKFAIMGFLDSLQGIIIVVGGRDVPGIMQNLLLQGIVPVTMVVSILALRSRGCGTCKQVRATLKQLKLECIEETTQPKTECSPEVCLCTVSARDRLYSPEQVQEWSRMPIHALRHELGEVPVILTTSAKSWRQHLRTFYGPMQYVGAVVLLAGLVLSAWPALVGGEGGGPPLSDLVFILACVPVGISAVYKQIAFEHVDLDVWLLNGWVATFQFLFSLAYAPLAAVMSGIAVHDIPMNLWNGIRCVFVGMNFIIPPQCSWQLSCGGPDTMICCDSCNAIYPDVSSFAALYAVMLFVVTNISYNVILILVIKYFNATMMFVASTVVLPLGGICFTAHAFMGRHALPFNVYNGVGLGVVIFGLIIYQFMGEWHREPEHYKPVPADKPIVTSATTTTPATTGTQPLPVVAAAAPMTAPMPISSLPRSMSGSAAGTPASRAIAVARGSPYELHHKMSASLLSTSRMSLPRQTRTHQGSPRVTTPRASAVQIDRWGSVISGSPRNL
eukprot:TRINITY_DN5907_c0_g1_i2.p1 TRINITY_DN5907_c0_g1~~TRINITY_DN5907_c0_g1_i2.p1  ORF type:complete len:605 (+),score=108.24 TRINITY_DN5907_c0_g1_i2:30-1844(+)